MAKKTAFWCDCCGMDLGEDYVHYECETKGERPRHGYNNVGWDLDVCFGCADKLGEKRKSHLDSIQIMRKNDK